MGIQNLQASRWERGGDAPAVMRQRNSSFKCRNPYIYCLFLGATARHRMALDGRSGATQLFQKRNNLFGPASVIQKLTPSLQAPWMKLPLPINTEPSGVKSAAPQSDTLSP